MVTEPEYFDEEAMRILRRAGSVTARRMSQSQLVHSIGSYDALVVRIEMKLDRRTLGKAARLRVIGSATTGLNHIDLEYAKRRGIRIINLHGTHTVPTAEHAFALILSLARKIPWAFEHMKEGKWQRYEFIGSQLMGKRLGVIGLGRIGLQLARHARAFGMDVVYYDPYVNYPGFRKVGLDALMRTSDVVSVNAMLTDETRGMIDYGKLKLMKKSALLVNTARGGIIDTAALLRALKNKVIAAAALDVFPTEPLENTRDPVVAYARSSENLIITPHIGASVREAVHLAGVEIARGVSDALEGA